VIDPNQDYWEVRKIIGREDVDGVLHYLVDLVPGTLAPDTGGGVSSTPLPTVILPATHVNCARLLHPPRHRHLVVAQSVMAMELARDTRDDARGDAVAKQNGYMLRSRAPLKEASIRSVFNGVLTLKETLHQYHDCPCALYLHNMS